jgi:hypothetical protein
MKRPAFGHLLGYTAITVILTAGAAQSLAGSKTVFGDDIVDGTITTPDLKAGSIAGSRLLNHGITGSKVYPNTLTGTEINESTLVQPDNSVTSAKIVDGSITGADVDESSFGTVPTATTADAATNILTALVNSDGTMRSQGRGASSSTESAYGTYSVVFDRRVDGCYYSATLVDTVGEIDAHAYVGLDGQAVVVQIHATNGAAIPAAFYLIVIC